MGLASKMAAAQASQAGGSAYPGGPPSGGGQGGYPPQGQQGQQGQQQYQAYPGGPPTGGQPGGQQGGYPPQGQQQYGGGPQQGQQQQYGGGPPGGGSAPAGPQQIQQYKSMLMATIQERNLQPFYQPNSPQLDQIAQRAAQQVDALCQKWKIHREIGQDIVKLALFDVVLYIDDSGSMAFEENGERIDDLKLILNRAVFAAGLFDSDGIQVRFMNNRAQGNNIRDENQVGQMIANTKFSGLTPMGTELDNKVIQPIIVGPARSGQLQKPVLVITITDGQPAGEPTNKVFDVIQSAVQACQSTRYGPGAVAFQFAQVGNDLKAREFLNKLDEHPVVGRYVDCTSNFEVEQDEMSKANPPVDLTPELWLIKLLLGAIDSSYDSKDEKTNPPPQGAGGYGGPQQGGYGGPQQGGYGGQQGGYGGQQGGYGGPQQQGGYGQQQGGYGGQQGGYGQQQQGGYGRPPPGAPQQGGYPSQQGGGGYGAPPPPRY